MSKRLILGVTIGGSSRLLDGQARYFRELGYDVYLISQNHEKEYDFCLKESITHLPVNISNQINPAKDLVALYQIVRHFNRIKPDIINVGTPKMGFLGILAGWLTGIKTRIYTCRGLRYETEAGLTKWILRSTERITVTLASGVIYVSPSLLSSAIRNKTSLVSKSVVLGNGSSNGVDLSVFNRRSINDDDRKKLKQKLGLEGKFIIGFVGRISKHKGVREIVQVFEQINPDHPETHLLMMGHTNHEKDLEARIDANHNIIRIPFQDNVPLYMSLFDILVLPSWREGFPNVSIQAAAMGLPVIASNATGCIDSVNNGINGIVFEKHNVDELKDAIIFYLKNPEIKQKHGQAGIEWAKQFRNDLIWNKLHELYSQNT